MRFGLRELIFLVVLLSVPVASFVFVFKPRNDEIQQANREIEIKTAKLDRLREVSSRIEDIGEAIEEWREAVEVIEAKLPDKQGVERILEQVWNLTEANGLEILSTKPDAAVPAATYMELPIKIEMTGDFDGFYQFLLELEQLQRITRVHEMKIVRAGQKSRRRSSSSDELPEGHMEVEFLLSIYYAASDAESQQSDNG